MHSNKTQIGTLTVTKGFTHVQHYETAAWYTEHEVQPGVYPVYYSRSGYNSGLLVTLATRIKSAYLGTLYGGVAVGKDTYGQSRIGKADTLSQSCGFYCSRKEKTLVPFASMGEFTATVDDLPCVGYVNEQTWKFSVQVITSEDAAILAMADSYCLA